MAIVVYVHLYLRKSYQIKIIFSWHIVVWQHIDIYLICIILETPSNR